MGTFARIVGGVSSIRPEMAANALGLHVRVGCHTGEVIVVAGYPHGLAGHATARVVALAEADEIFVSSTTRDLLSANDFSLDPVGSFELKGLTGPVRCSVVIRNPLQQAFAY